MNVIDKKYVVDVGWPWTSDKMMCTCVVCNLGVFKLITEERIPVHRHCMKEVEDERHKYKEY